MSEFLRVPGAAAPHEAYRAAAASRPVTRRYPAVTQPAGRPKPRPGAALRHRRDRSQHRGFDGGPLLGVVPRAHEIERVDHVTAEGGDARRAYLRAGHGERGAYP